MKKNLGMTMLLMVITIGLLMNGVAEVKAESGVTVIRSSIVRGNTWSEIGKLLIEAENYALKNDDVMLLKLPEDFKFYADNLSISGPVISGNPRIITYTITGNTGGQQKLIIPEEYAGEPNDLFTANGNNPLKITALSRNEMKIELLNYISTGARNVMYLELNEVYVPGGHSGSIPVYMDAPSGSGWPVNKTVVADTGRSLPGEPKDLKAEAIATHSITLTWRDNSDIEDGFIIWAQPTGNNYSKLATVKSDSEKYVINNLEPDTEYRFKVTAYNANGESDYSNETIAKTAVQNEMKLKINQKIYAINGQEKLMDTVPIIIQDRVFLPLRSIAEGLGAEVEWNPLQNKAIVKTSDKIIQLTLDSNKAIINGQETLISAENPDIRPIVVDERILLPLRFIAEGLHQNIEWNPTEQVITIYNN